MPSSSARCSQLPRAVDKLPFYVALRKLRDHLRGDLPNLDDSDLTFPNLELKVEPKKEKLDVEVKQEMADPGTSTALISGQQANSDPFQLAVGIKTEDDSVTGKQRKGQRKRSSKAGGGAKEISVPRTVTSSAGTVCSPYFLPWQPLSLSGTDSVGTGQYTTAAAVDTTHLVKKELPFDMAQFGHMPEDLSTRRTYRNMLPLPDVKPRYS